MPNDRSALNVVIVDDEKRACTNLKNLLQDYVDAEINVAGIANNTEEAEAQILKFSPDAVFLDIEMPNENAFHFMERISPVCFEVIFVTAYDEYAIKAFKLNALDYILKPISIIELKNAIEKLKEKIRYKKIIGSKLISYKELANEVTNKIMHYKIILKDINTTEVVDFKDIYFVEAQGSYSRILFLKDNEIREMVLSNPLSDYEELLPDDQFYRIHRSFLINCVHIKKIINDGSNQVVMKNELVIPVSRRRYAALLNFLENKDYL
jgi:two-component system LytT family response regulator